MFTRTCTPCHAQRGVALLLALITLLLISGVGATILYMAATESSLVSYQRTSTRAYAASLGGLEEGRARLSTSDPTFLGDPNTFAIPFPAAVGDVLYILNPDPAGEFTLNDVITPGNPYYDWEYDREWCPVGGAPCGALAAANVQVVPSSLAAVAGLVPPIPYKWVRVTVLTEEAGKRDINGDAALDNAIPVFWDAATNRTHIAPDPDGPGPDDRPGREVYRITAMARTEPTGATRLVQYDVSAPRINANFPAAITLLGGASTCGQTPGDDPDFAQSNVFDVRGDDQAPGAPAGAHPALGTTDPNTTQDCACEIRGSAGGSKTPPPPCPGYSGNNNILKWTGQGFIPSIGDISGTTDPDLLTTGGLQALITAIRDNADQVFTAADPPPNNNLDPSDDTVTLPADTNMGNCDGATYAPQVTVIDGDVTLDPQHSGCGILLVTGDLTVTGNWDWKGVLLAVGEGSWCIEGAGNGGLQGASYVARIYCDEDEVGTDPNCPGVPTMLQDPPAGPGPSGSLMCVNGGGSADVNYNSVWINNAVGSIRYRVLAYREMTQ